MIWPVLRLVWESSGQKMEGISEALKARWPKGYSVTSLQRLTTETTDEVPEDVAEFILALPTQKGFEETAKIVRAGLATLEGRPWVDPEAIAASLAEKLPTLDPEVITRAILAQLQAGKGSLLGKLARRVARLAKRLDAILSAVGKLALMEATVNHTDARLELVEVKLEKAKREILRAVYGSAGLLVGLGIAAMAFVHCEHVQPVPPASQNVTLNMGTGAAEQAAKGGQGQEDPYGDRTPAIGAGERKSGRPMPHHPLPRQAKAPCQGSESTLYGGCWQETSHPIPCPPDTYQEGQKCYIPMAADPNVPVEPNTEQPRSGKGKPAGEQSRSMQEMPAKEEH